ncbi:2Fe-2S iron-sulfur cluster-binding protein [Polaromonas sp. UC242_47]|uniref:2Fe-2S iron-sulfur cluster-binding protein n=1 Tax=Polaromonas sp. UC242_47 TaxID=3374626 RepID=UPI003798DC08
MSHQISIEAADAAFACAPGQSLLDAALRAGIDLPYSCRKGVCGSCVGQIAAGEVTGINGAAIRNDSCTPEQVLYCMCTPASDLVLRPMSWTRIDPSARKTFTARVHSNELAAPDVSLLKLRLPTGQRAKFKAGQYLQILLDDGSTRSYSFANPPQESDGAILHIRHVAGGRFSAQVAQLAPGDTLQIELPFGHVALREDETRPIVFVAGGTGFAPVKSILDDLLKRRVQRPVTLIWGARDQAGLYLRPAVARWQKQWPDFRFVPALSEGPADNVGDTFAGRVDQALRACCPDLSGHEVYCCGSPPMVAAVRAAAAESGLASADFHADVFVPGPSAPPA